MLSHLFTFSTVLLLLMGSSNIAKGVGVYNPPCEEALTAKQHTLKKLNHCLERSGRPPFNEKNNLQSKSLCPNELNDYETAVNHYRQCLEKGKSN